RGQPEREGRALAGLALDRDVAAEGMRDPQTDRQAEAQAARRRCGGVPAVELVEKPIAVFGRDSRAGVRDGQRQPTAAAVRAVFGHGGGQGDPAACGRVLQCVRYQVADDRSYPLLVGRDGRQFRGHLALDGQALSLRLEPVVVRHGGEDSAHIGWRYADVELRRFRPAQLEEVGDDLHRGADSVPDPRDHLQLLWRERPTDAHLEELSVAIGHAQWILQVVADAADEPGPALRRLLGLDAAALGDI